MDPNGVAISCSNARVNHNELRIMFGFLVTSYSFDTRLSNCTVSHHSRANITAVTQNSTTSRQWHLLTCSQTSQQSNYSHIQQLDIWIYSLISTRFWLRFQGQVETWGSQDGDDDVLSPWSSHCKPVDMYHHLRGTCRLHHPDDGGCRYSEMLVCICQTTWFHNWKFLWHQICLVSKR